MRQIHYCTGLPRTCSTVLMNILSQNPEIFTTSTCPLPLFVEACQGKTVSCPDFTAMDQDVLTKSYLNFLRQGIKGWFESMTTKEVVISKSRLWQDYFPHTFAIDENSKYLILIRDLRDIVCSFESLLWKNPNIVLQTSETSQLYMESYETRIDVYFDERQTLGKSFRRLPHILELSNRYPDKFLIARQEDFNTNPYTFLKNLYKFFELDYFKHNLKDIPKSVLYEHDSVYRDLVSHKVGKSFKPKPARWEKEMTAEASKKIVTENQWFYNLFYNEHNFPVKKIKEDKYRSI
tara:strand:+ start:404 stop:1279 length:876 start_codon:yes stop_codon:yes gene_type:complete